MTLSQLKLVAVVMGENRKIAMVEEATGKGYEVKIGTYMGKNEGQVVDIQPDRIVVREMGMDFKGVVTERFQELKLHKADGGE
jgi:type IV pilus assembly protein PilP